MKYVNLKAYGRNKISFYLALEQYRLTKLSEDEFFLWDIPPSIVIGRNQLIQSEVNVNFTKEHQVEIFRRPSGGGAIFADEGCFMYTFLTKEKNKDLVYEKCLTKLLLVLKELGLDVYFSGRNDLMFQNKKFSGTAFLQTKDGSVLHGTFLYDTDLAKLVEALTVDQEKITSKGIKSVSERVINIKPYVNLSKEALMDEIAGRICDSTTTLSKEEFEEVKKIEEKYASPEWIFGKNPRYSFHNKKRFSYGNIEVFLLIKNDIIQEFTLQGDFFQLQNLDGFTSKFINLPFEKKRFTEVLENHPLEQYIENAKNIDLIELIFKGGEE